MYEHDEFRTKRRTYFWYNEPEGEQLSHNPNCCEHVNIATQTPIELTPDLLEKLGGKYIKIELTPDLLEKLGGKYIKLGEGGTVFNPSEEFWKLSEEKKAELEKEIIKTIEKLEAEQEKKEQETEKKMELS